MHEGSAGATSNGCYTTPVYHSHTTSCYKSCGGSYSITGNGAEGTYVVKCSRCGNTAYKKVSDWNAGSGRTHNSQILNCSINTNLPENYVLGCGKTEETIESATIIY